MKPKTIIIPLLIILFLNTVNAELYTPIKQRSITIGENQDYIYIKTHKIIYNDYFALSKQEKGEIHIAHNNKYVAKMFLIPAFKHPTNNKWYLCPLRNLNNITTQKTNTTIYWQGDNEVTCYEYNDRTQTGNTNLAIQGNITISQEGKIKISSKIRIHDITPTDTGFGYLILPTQTQKYRYAKINNVYKDLTAEEKNLTIDKTIEFFDNNQNPIRHKFDWTDMLDTGKFFMEIGTFGDNKGLLVGTYGYGANNIITVDPIYIVDYEPNPAEHLYKGDVQTDNDNSFQIILDITNHMGDNLTNISYVTIDSGGVGQAISGAWSQTYNNTSKWFLRIYKTNMGNSGTPHIYAYKDDDNISNNYSTYSSPTGIGWYNYPVDSQMRYQHDILGLNYTKLRFFTTSVSSWAELQLRKEYNDTTPPTIYNCWVNNNIIGCNGTASWECNITDDLDVNNVNFTINEKNYTAIQYHPHWYYNITFNDTTDINETLTLTDVYAYDIFNQLNHTTLNLSINHICQIYNCTPNWTLTYGACQTNDTMLLTYYDTNNCNTTEGLPPDNGTSVYCNYCTENLVQNLGECQPNGKQTVNHTDTNYTTCCLVTGLLSDCSILYYPYNETTTQNCTYYTTQFNCTYDPEPVLNKKINVICTLPNDDYCCLVNVYQNKNLLATTPEYKSTSNSFLTLISEKEERTCFTPQQKLLNAYYTEKELRPNTLYTLEVMCSSTNGTVIVSQHPITPVYHIPDWLPHRLKWLGEHPVLLIVTLVAIILLFLFVVWVVKKIRAG